MKVVAFFPIKLNNERAPGKNTKQFKDGTPLMYFVQKNLLSLKNKNLIDEVYCFCSDQAVERYLLKGVKFLERDASLDRKETMGTEIYDAFVKRVNSDIYILTHATSPFVTAEHIEECLQHVKSGEYDSAFCAKKIQNFLWQNRMPLNFKLDKPPRTQDMEPIYMELSTPYVFTKETWQRYHSRSGMNPYICEASEIEAVDIDYPEDFALADIIYTSLLK